jgi:hypothetical protein
VAIRLLPAVNQMLIVRVVPVGLLTFVRVAAVNEAGSI